MSKSSERPTHIWRNRGNLYGRSDSDSWEQLLVFGETSRSWLIGDAERSWMQWKVPKTKHNPSQFAFSQREIDDYVWADRNRYRIGQAVMSVQDADILRQVAALIGYL